MEHYQIIIAGSGLPEGIKAMLSSREPYTLDELDESYGDLIHFLKHKEYYILLDRVEKGEAYKAQQTDPAMIAAAQRKIDKLASELEQLQPKEEIA
ncbi:hypothetical protein [Paenibacillus silvisoli]|uniref:hypothetical protein n=1 Tax=Paenibacillus silvisoli TaxID=3110539 RepID=UPI0028064D1C|nr:hypothetical protein [Paenibacillus silvisoli]